MNVNSAPGSDEQMLRRAALALYAWLFCQYSGLVGLDSVYANLLRTELEPAVTSEIFIKISDLFIFPCGLLMLSGARALAVSVYRPAVLRLVLISCSLPVISLGLYLVFAETLAASGFGPPIRILSVATGSILALAAVIRFCRLRSAPG